MLSSIRKYLFLVWLLAVNHAYSQGTSDTLRYRSTGFHGSVSNLIIVSPVHPNYGSFFPAASLSLKSGRADSLYRPLKDLNFSILVGAAASRYLFFEEKYFINFLDKDPFHVLSKRFWGGFGINYRKPVSKNLVFDADITPCIQIMVDKSEESKTDTSGWNSVLYENIYQGIHLNAYCKLEYKMQGSFSPFVSLTASLPLLHSIARDAGDEPYHNTFKGQLFIGVGLSYHYHSRHIVEPDNKAKSKK